MFPILYLLYRQQFDHDIEEGRAVSAMAGIQALLGLYVETFPNLQALIDKAQAFVDKYANRNDLTHEEYDAELDEANGLVKEFYGFEKQYNLGREGL